jgi:hypothetical protein
MFVGGSKVAATPVRVTTAGAMLTRATAPHASPPIALKMRGSESSIDI